MRYYSAPDASESFLYRPDAAIKTKDTFQRGSMPARKVHCVFFQFPRTESLVKKRFIAIFWSLVSLCFFHMVSWFRKC